VTIFGKNVQGGKHPMREAPKRLALRALLGGKYLGDEHPDDRPLPDSVDVMDQNRCGSS
jgi:hypothetical protein